MAHDAGARGVDKNRPRLNEPQLTGTDEVFRRLVQREVDRDDVRPSQQVI